MVSQTNLYSSLLRIILNTNYFLKTVCSYEAKTIPFHLTVSSCLKRSHSISFLNITQKWFTVEFGTVWMVSFNNCSKSLSFVACPVLSPPVKVTISTSQRLQPLLDDTFTLCTHPWTTISMFWDKRWKCYQYFC